MRQYIIMHLDNSLGITYVGEHKNLVSDSNDAKKFKATAKQFRDRSTMLIDEHLIGLLID